jgi:hypothetical protein
VIPAVSDETYRDLVAHIFRAGGEGAQSYMCLNFEFVALRMWCPFLEIFGFGTENGADSVSKKPVLWHRDSDTWYSTHTSSTLLRFNCENDVII